MGAKPSVAASTDNDQLSQLSVLVNPLSSLTRKERSHYRHEANTTSTTTKQNAELRGVKVDEAVRAPVPISRYGLCGSKATFEDEEKSEKKKIAKKYCTA